MIPARPPEPAHWLTRAEAPLRLACHALDQRPPGTKRHISRREGVALTVPDDWAEDASRLSHRRMSWLCPVTVVECRGYVYAVHNLPPQYQAELERCRTPGSCRTTRGIARLRGVLRESHRIELQSILPELESPRSPACRGETREVFCYEAGRISSTSPPRAHPGLRSGSGSDGSREWHRHRQLGFSAARCARHLKQA